MTTPLPPRTEAATDAAAACERQRNLEEQANRDLALASSQRLAARAGITALIYDHRNFGVSEGEPRFEINPWVQCRGYRDALDYASTLEEIDPERITQLLYGGQDVQDRDALRALDERWRLCQRPQRRGWFSRPAAWSAAGGRRGAPPAAPRAHQPVR